MNKNAQENTQLSQLSDEELKREIEQNLRFLKEHNPVKYQKALRYRAATFILLATE